MLLTKSMILKGGYSHISKLIFLHKIMWSVKIEKSKSTLMIWGNI
jgi:hypothetical protein